MKTLKLIQAYIRCLIWGFCPKCNSSAPEMDNCTVCQNYRETPAPRFIRDMWWRWFRQELKK